MTHKAIPIIAFHGYIIICLCHLCEYVLYVHVHVVKEVVSFWEARSINGHGA